MMGVVLAKLKVHLAIFSLVFVWSCNHYRQEDGRDEFFAGRSLVVSGNYQRAVSVLRRYLQANPKARHASRAGLFLGKAYLALGQYQDARAAWENTVATFPGSLEGHKCRYKLAFLGMIMGDGESARRQFEELASRPNGPLAPEAKAFAAYLTGTMKHE